MKKLRVGIAGLGRLGKVHAYNLAYRIPEAELVAACSIVPAELEYAKAELGVQEVYTDYREMLAKADIDAVVIVTTSGEHCWQVEAALEAGKHVFTEKPLGVNVEQCRMAEAAVEKHPELTFMLGFMRRYDKSYAYAKQKIEEGAIGTPYLVKSTGLDPETLVESAIRFCGTSGGIFLDMMIHDLDMLRYLSGDEVEELTAYGANLVDPAIGEAGDVDTVVISAKMAGGALAAIDGCRKAVYGYDQRGEVFGSKGCIASSNDAANNTVLSTADGIISEKPLWFFLERYMGAYQDEIKSFVNCIVNDTEPEVGIEDGLVSVKLAIACKRSMDEKRPVRLDEIH